MYFCLRGKGALAMTADHVEGGSCDEVAVRFEGYFVGAFTFVGYDAV